MVFALIFFYIDLFVALIVHLTVVDDNLNRIGCIQEKHGAVF